MKVEVIVRSDGEVYPNPGGCDFRYEGKDNFSPIRCRWGYENKLGMTQCLHFKGVEVEFEEKKSIMSCVCDRRVDEGSSMESKESV